MFKKGYIPWNKNKKIGFSYWKGKHLSTETKRKMSIAHKGQIVWNKGIKLPYSTWNKGIHTGIKPLLGKKHSEETRKKMSNSRKEYYKNNFHSMKGKKRPQEFCKKISNSLKGHIGYMLGKKHSEEAKRKISLALRGRPAFNIMYGKDNPAWKGGVTKQKNYSSLKTKKRKYLKKCGGVLSIQTIQLVYEDNIKKYGTLTCYLCLRPIEFCQDSLEHKIPLSRDGTNEYINLAIAHKNCNSKKGIKTEEEYMMQRRGAGAPI